MKHLEFEQNTSKGRFDKIIADKEEAITVLKKQKESGVVDELAYHTELSDIMNSYHHKVKKATTEMKKDIQENPHKYRAKQNPDKENEFLKTLQPGDLALETN